LKRKLKNRTAEIFALEGFGKHGRVGRVYALFKYYAEQEHD
jgi:hypothetical protein